MMALLVAGALTWRWMLAPPSTPPDRVPPADAIVLFVGGNGERLEAALELVEAGKADVLVIPNGTAPNWPAANALCAGSADVEVICPTPDPDTTRGEARTIGKLAAERGWTSLIMVTSTYHLNRAELMLARCYQGQRRAVAASPDLGIGSWAMRVAHEWLGHLHARVVARGC